MSDQCMRPPLNAGRALLLARGWIKRLAWVKFISIPDGSVLVDYEADGRSPASQSIPLKEAMEGAVDLEAEASGLAARDTRVIMQVANSEGSLSYMQGDFEAQS